MHKQYRIVIVLIAILTVGLFILIQQAASASVDTGQASVAGDVLAQGPISEMYLPIIQKFHAVERPLWRFGIGTAQRNILDFGSGDVKKLRLGWYVDWGINESPEPYGIEYMPMVRVKQWKDDGAGNPVNCCVGCAYLEPHSYTTTPSFSEITSYAAAHPGKVWLLGNEIERQDWSYSDGSCGHQDEILPELYATAYHDLYLTIKAADPTAEVSIGGVIQATPLRLEYLTRMWNTYQMVYAAAMPVDVWNVHAFVLREEAGSWGAGIPAGSNETEGMLYDILDTKDFSIVQGHLIAMRQWMKDRGQQNKALIIPEYGVLMPDWIDPAEFSYEDVRDDFMIPSFNFFLTYTDASIGYPADGNRLVQRWNWYSLDDDSGWYEEEVFYQSFGGNLFFSGLFDQPQGLSDLGQYWIDYVESLPLGHEPPY